ncbi:MAG: hypothetical protein AVDCRST_MAG75-2573 [uncultured Propionibacteriaceae bacterium]|uniref:GAF domain-containing protein n=1 Tax=uncultured Propionibacteriaceae bacterium TaxID=257457 RepID=A0A6J4PF06_9ACTN|nr:MAG: hypothetical protein AVDCRST_MAG75-2573 [uncultured Propionibacteriaceae bacterium]
MQRGVEGAASGGAGERGNHNERRTRAYAPLSGADLTTDPRWPAYAPKAVAMGIKSQVGIVLYEEDDTIGGLNLYGQGANVLDDEALHTAELFATHAAAALGRALTYSQMTESMASRQLVGQATGIIMERYQIDKAHASRS